MPTSCETSRKKNATKIWNEKTNARKRESSTMSCQKSDKAEEARRKAQLGNQGGRGKRMASREGGKENLIGGKRVRPGEKKPRF